MSNMYPWVSHTWNPIKGRCPHKCKYCYYQSNPRFKKLIGDLRLDDKALSDNLGFNKTIFVGSSTDIFADDVPDVWIKLVLGKCVLCDKNKYLFQTKNPDRFKDFIFPENTILGVTIETNRDYECSKAPPTIHRYYSFKGVICDKKMVSIEPLLDFDLVPFLNMIKGIKPIFVSIGADSKGNNLPEPSKEKTLALIRELKEFTEVRVKDNLKRIIG